MNGNQKGEESPRFVLAQGNAADVKVHRGVFKMLGARKKNFNSVRHWDNY